MQLVSYGYESFFLTTKPQITFFKIVYRRHTNFSYEQMRQNFSDIPDFSKTLTCSISKNADLMGGIIAVITLPQLNQIDNYTKFAWVRKIGFSVIKYVNIQLNGVEIDKHYAEWLNLWAELSGYIRGEKSDGFNKMIGNIPELYNFSFSKDPYVLYVPLQFWFCKHSGAYLPLVAMGFTNIKISIQFNDVDKCYLITPTNYINSYDDIVNFIPGEYIQQIVGNNTASGIFDRYDIINKRIYYYKISHNNFSSIETLLSSHSDISNILTLNSSKQYLINGLTSKYECYPDVNSKEKSHNINVIRNIKLGDTYLLVDYYYIDEDERNRFTESKHDYLIEQLSFNPNHKITGGNNILVNVNSVNPCKFILWINQLEYIYNSGDYFNYTDSYIRKKFNTEYLDLKIDNTIGNNIASNEYIVLNGKICASNRSSTYFEKIEPYKYLKYQLPKGSNMFSFSIYAYLDNPTGTCNMSQIESTQIGLKISNNKDVINCRSYALCNNILRIAYGYSALVFIN